MFWPKPFVPTVELQVIVRVSSPLVTEVMAGETSAKRPCCPGVIA